ncbi:MAG: hypothetical protein NTU81_01300 [Candidatus Nomurabacteria bacterium]|nr:hypothetical protein [Candidatus Nomurabacteria bacterium]
MDSNENNVDISEMASVTKISVPTIEFALGLPLKANSNKPKNIDEARINFLSADAYSDERLQALIDWLSFVTSPTEARKVFKNVSVGTIYEALAFKKWDELSLIEANKIKTQEDFKKVLRESPQNSEAKQVALAKNEALSLDQFLKVGKNYQLLKKLLGTVHKNSYVATMILLKMEEVAKNSKEIKEVCELSPENSNAKFKALKKWEKISMNEGIIAKNVVELMEALKNTPPHYSEARFFIIKKIALFFNSKK